MDTSTFGRFAERLAVNTYRRFDLDPGKPACPIGLAKALLKSDDPIEYADLPAGHNGILYGQDGEQSVAVRRGLPLDRALFAVAHELAHILFEEIGFETDPRIENACDYLAACLLAPAPAVRDICTNTARPVLELASATALTTTWAALRIGEALQQPVFVVETRPQLKIRYRGGARELPIASDVGLLCSAAIGAPIPGLRKVQLHDAPTPRAALLVA